MGIYDRDYERDRDVYDDSPGFHLGSQLTLTTKLVIFMGAVYVVQLLAGPWFTNLFSLHANLLAQPWLVFELVTYGFLHDPGDLRHILFNCFALWMFGRAVEFRYGPREYLAFFLAAVVFAGLVWVIGELASNRGIVQASMLGASGGIAAVLILYCLNYPKQQIYIWGILPLPAWVFALVFVGMDIFGSIHPQKSTVAFTAHIGGALFALIYFFAGWRFSNLLPTSFRMPKLGRRPSLRVHDPVDDVTDADEAEVDDILRKIKEQGQDSLTRRERQILEQASREYQKRRQ